MKQGAISYLQAVIQELCKSFQNENLRKINYDTNLPIGKNVLPLRHGYAVEFNESLEPIQYFKVKSLPATKLLYFKPFPTKKLFWEVYQKEMHISQLLLSTVLHYLYLKGECDQFLNKQNQ